jgi:hypothetical protein
MDKVHSDLQWQEKLPNMRKVWQYDKVSGESMIRPIG